MAMTSVLPDGGMANEDCEPCQASASRTAAAGSSPCVSSCDVLFVAHDDDVFDLFLLQLSQVEGDSPITAPGGVETPRTPSAASRCRARAEPLLKAVPLLHERSRAAGSTQPQRFLVRAAELAARLPGAQLLMPRERASAIDFSTPSTWLALLHRIGAEVCSAPAGLRDELLARVDMVQHRFVCLAMKGGDGLSPDVHAEVIATETQAIIQMLIACQHSPSMDDEMAQLAEFVAVPGDRADVLAYGIVVVAKMRQLVEARLPAPCHDPPPFGALRLALLSSALGAESIAAESLAAALGTFSSDLFSDSGVASRHELQIRAALRLLGTPGNNNHAIQKPEHRRPDDIVEELLSALKVKADEREVTTELTDIIRELEKLIVAPKHNKHEIEKWIDAAVQILSLTNCTDSSSAGRTMMGLLREEKRWKPLKQGIRLSTAFKPEYAENKNDESRITGPAMQMDEYYQELTSKCIEQGCPVEIVEELLATLKADERRPTAELAEIIHELEKLIVTPKGNKNDIEKWLEAAVRILIPIQEGPSCAEARPPNQSEWKPLGKPVSSSEVFRRPTYAKYVANEESQLGKVSLIEGPRLQMSTPFFFPSAEVSETSRSPSTDLADDPTVQRAREWLCRRGMSLQKSEDPQRPTSGCDKISSGSDDRPALRELSMNCNAPSDAGQGSSRHNLSLNPPSSWRDDRTHISSRKDALNEESGLGCAPAECSKELASKSSSRGRGHQYRTPSPLSTSRRRAVSSAASEQSQLLATRGREANEDRLRARARAAGHSLPARQAVRSAQRRVNSSRKRWAGESPALQGSDASAVRSNLFRQRDARIRQFLERELARSEASQLSPAIDSPPNEACGSDAPAHAENAENAGDAERSNCVDANVLDEEPVSLSFLEAEAEALAEELCTPSPPPQPCPLPTPMC